MTDQELQLALAKMLPGKIYPSGVNEDIPRWEGRGCLVEISEWLHACWLVENRLSRGGMLSEYDRFENALAVICCVSGANPTSASWQQRAEALCKVKGVSA